ncbi:EamA family transporter [Candidatus Oleimmundimicrobium sp.]|uniref:DMT family transporter n=1 Tax=Candidatus Oleimmundimicrobium sp. TaxID=3060597 RepID=UPI002717D592|nr:EamA family transporter [Candidatus Oleimmundimicrobium sp.]MDO8885666.1 EamA family transporter [Candidatus Oleimmundimicrobium sp.]
MNKGKTKTIPVFMGYLKICLAAIIWGSLGIFVRVINLPITEIVFFRVVFAATATFAVVVAQKKLFQLKLKRHRGLMILRGAGLTINWLMFFCAIRFTTIANAVLLTYTAPIFIVLLLPIFLKEKIELKTIFSLILSMIGITLIIFPGLKIGAGTHLFGMICALGAAITYALLVITSKYLLDEYTPASLVFYESFISFLILTPFMFVNFSKPTSGELLILIIMGVVNTALAAFLYISGLKQVKAQHAGVLAYLDPLTATILAILFLSEVPTIYTVVGGILVLIAGLNIIIQKRIEQPLIPD